MDDSWGEIFKTDRATPMDGRFAESTRIAGYATEYDWESDTASFFLNGREVSENEFDRALTELNSGYQRITYTPSVLDISWRRTTPAVSDNELRAFLDSFAPPIIVLLNGSPMTFDVPPQIISGSTMVPMRAIFNELGATVSWDGPTRTITATRGSDVVALTIGATHATFNGGSRPLNQPAVIVGGSTLVPLRFVSEALGANVRWDGATRTVAIMS